MTTFSRVIIWVWVVSAGILLGGAIYETLVLTPMWAGSVPESVMAWPHGVPQVRFFGVATPFYGLCSLLLLITSSWMPAGSKKFAIVAGAAGVVIVVWTFLFFVPILQQTQATRGAGLEPEEIARLTNQFVSWHYLRLSILVVGWFAGLKAFRISGE